VFGGGAYPRCRQATGLIACSVQSQSNSTTANEA
jgi:hypothetical protein